MFPGLTFSAVPTAPGTYRDQDERTYVIEHAVEGSFTGAGAEELLLVVVRPEEELTYLEGFYQAYAAVFAESGRRLVSDVNHMVADEGLLGFFRDGQGRSYLFFGGNVTFQGWSEFDGGLWAATPAWERIWPIDPGFWSDRATEVLEDRLVIMKRELRPGRDSQLIPDYDFVFSHILLWNAELATFVPEA